MAINDPISFINFISSFLIISYMSRWDGVSNVKTAYDSDELSIVFVLSKYSHCIIMVERMEMFIFPTFMLNRYKIKTNLGIHSALSIFITYDVMFHRFHYRVRVWLTLLSLSLSLFHVGYKERHCYSISF